MKRDRGITVQLCFVVRGKAYFTIRTATQAVAGQIVNNVDRRTWNRPATEYRDRQGRRGYDYWRRLQKKAYNRCKPIVTKVFPK